jgi:hypothetical protein
MYSGVPAACGRGDPAAMLLVLRTSMTIGAGSAPASPARSSFASPAPRAASPA